MDVSSLFQCSPLSFFLLMLCCIWLLRTGKSDLHYAKVAELAVLGLPGRISRLSRVAKYV